MIIIAGLSMFAAFASLGISEYFLPTLLATAALIFAACINWKLRAKPWFWITLLGFAALHVPLVVWLARNVSQKGHLDGHGLAGLVFFDAGLITAVIRFPAWLKSSLEWFRPESVDGKEVE